MYLTIVLENAQTPVKNISYIQEEALIRGPHNILCVMYEVTHLYQVDT